MQAKLINQKSFDKKKSNYAALFNKAFFFSITSADIQQLMRLAARTKNKSFRFCAHNNKNELVHEMVIAHKKGTYVRPHKHLCKPESLLIINGEADYLLFSEKGKLVKRIAMGTYYSNKPFYQSTRKDMYHSIIIRSPWLVFLEITRGPFRRNQTVYANWSPESNHTDDGVNFLENVKELFEKKLLS